MLLGNVTIISHLNSDIFLSLTWFHNRKRSKAWSRTKNTGLGMGGQKVESRKASRRSHFNFVSKGSSVW